MDPASGAAPAARRPLRPGRRKLLLWGGAAVLAGVLALLFRPGEGVPAGAGSVVGGEPVFQVTRSPLTISFSERGSIKAARSEQIFCTMEGTSTIVNVVPEGTYVKKGDLLVELDSSELTQLYNQQSIAVETARAALVQADETVEIQKNQNESDIKAAELAVSLADIDKKKYEEGDWPLARDKAKADIFIADEELKRAENRYTWTEKLAQKGYVTRTELVADDLAVKKAKVQFEQATRAKRVLEQYTHQKDSRKVESDLEQADRALKRTNLKAASQLTQALADQKGKKSTYDLSLRRLEKIKDQIQKTRIQAPEDGMVVYKQDGRWSRDDRMIEQGATVRENQHLIDLPDLSVMAVTVQIPEARIHQIREGLRATITVDAHSDLALAGSVTKIGLLPDYVNRWMNPDLKVYLTEVTIEPGQYLKDLRPGMSARVEIVVAELPPVLHVPVQSVTTIDGKPVCFVWRGEAFLPQPVELGLANDSFVEVRSGLTEDDLVKLNAPRPQGTPGAAGKDADAPPGEGEVGRAEGYPAPASYRDREEGSPRAAKGRGEEGRKRGRKRGGSEEDRERSRESSPGRAPAPGGGEPGRKAPATAAVPGPDASVAAPAAAPSGGGGGSSKPER